MDENLFLRAWHLSKIHSEKSLILLVCAYIYTVSFQIILKLLKFILSSPISISNIVVFCSLQSKLMANARKTS